jgi:hypothetical protein
MENIKTKLLGAALGASGGVAGMASLAGCSGGACTSCFGCAGVGFGLVVLAVLGKRKKISDGEENGMA